MKIYAPVKTANGVYASVKFVNGIGETDNPHLLEWFESHGYTIEKEQSTPTVENIAVKVVDEEPPMMGYPMEELEAMTSLELRNWMKENGFGRDLKNIRDKEKLLKIIRG